MSDHKIDDAGGTTTSFSNSTQAKDDGYLAADFDGFQYEDGATLRLDVMAGDGGGKAKTLYSISGDDPDLQQAKNGNDYDANLLDKDAVGDPQEGPHGSQITITADGEVEFKITQDFLDYLAEFDEGEPVFVTFTYAIQLGNGTLSWATVTVEFEGLGSGDQYFTLNFTNPLEIVADPDHYQTFHDPDTQTFDPAMNGAAGLDGDEDDNPDSPDGTNGGDGLAAITITNAEPYAGILINADGDGPHELYGGSGGTGGTGANGAPGENGGDGGDGGNGGHAIVNGDLNEVIITGTANLTILGGDGGAGGKGGGGWDTVVVSNSTNSGNEFTANDGGDGGDGGSGGTGIGEGGDGGDGGSVTIETNEGNNTTLTAGDGGDGGVGGGDGGDGGDATILSNSANNIHLNAGDGGDGGEGGGLPGTSGSFSPNSAGGSSSFDGGAAGTAGLPYLTENPIIGAFSHRVDVDASDFEGDLTISGSNYVDEDMAGDDTMVFGSGMTKVYATTGNDEYDVSNGDVTVTYTWHGQSDGTVWTDTIDGWGDGDDIIDVSGMYDGDLTWVNDGALGEFSIGWFEEGGNTYVVADVTGDNIADFKVELLGTGLNLSDGDFVL